MKYAKLLAERTEMDPIAGSTDILAADFTPARDDSIIRITIAIATANANLILIPSTGLGEGFFLKNAAVITFGSVYMEDVSLDRQRSWNLQTLSAAIHVVMVRVVELAGV